MNIGMNTNMTPNFKGLYVSTEGMGKTAAKLANNLESELSYTKQISALDRKRIDVVIMADKEHPADRAKIVFAAPDNSLYKINGKDHIKTGKKIEYPGAEPEYSTNSESVIDSANKILNKDITERTLRTTKTQRELEEQFPIRSNSNVIFDV